MAEIIIKIKDIIDKEGDDAVEITAKHSRKLDPDNMSVAEAVSVILMAEASALFEEDIEVTNLAPTSKTTH